MRSYALAASALMLAACAGATTDPSSRAPASAHVVDATLGTDVTLGVGESARFDGGQLTVTFRRVVQDSRCPSTVVCVWEGDGAVELWLKRRGISAAATLHTTETPQMTDLDGYTVRLLELEPYPAASPIDPAAYLVRLRVEGPET